MDWLKVDDTTVLLGITFVAVYAASKLLQPQSLVHPLLLGRQADVGRVRLPGESAVYRNYATGIMGRLPERPKPEIRLVTDLVRDDHTEPRLLWSKSITNAQLKRRAKALGAGLLQVAGLIPRESTVLNLLDDSLEFLVTDLALARHSVISFTLSSLSLLVPALERHAPTAVVVSERFLGHILEHVSDLKQSFHHTIIVVGDDKGSSVAHSQRTGIRILRWEDLEASGMTKQVLDVPTPDPSDILTVSLFSNGNGELCGAELSHANVTAGVTATRLLFPLAQPLSPSDTILSVHSLHGAFGRAVAYTAVYEGTNFLSLAPQLPDEGVRQMSDESRLLRACKESASTPTLLFITSDYLKPLTNSLIKAAHSSLLFGLAWRFKLTALQHGYIAKNSFWDKMAFQSARKMILGKLESSLRGIAISGGRVESAALEPARIAFSVPMVFAHTHPLVCGPVLASHPLDMQSFPDDNAPNFNAAHVGPPATNVEAKLAGVLDASVDQGGDPVGDLFVRGPSVGKLSSSPVQDPEGWVPTGEKARVQTNGTFKVD